MSKKYSATNYLLYLLSKREYSESELRSKFKHKEYSAEEIDHAIEHAQANNWQSDERFCRFYIRYRSQQGYGPRRLKQELQQRGINNDLISLILEESEIDWFELAEHIFNKKRPHIWDIKSKQKMWRYMINHGFYQDHFNHLLDIDYNGEQEEYDE